MKILLSLIIAGSALLIAGGDILPVRVVTKFEKPIMMKAAPTPRGCYKPNIVKCPDCEDVAELCPDDPNLPIAQTEVCEALVNGR